MTGYDQPPSGIVVDTIKTITCQQCSGNPAPSFKWYGTDETTELQTTAPPTVDANLCSTDTFALPPAKIADNDKSYKCEALNNIGTPSSKMIKMNVLCT